MKIKGVFESKGEAEEKKSNIMEPLHRIGRDRVLVGDTWHDEYDLVVKTVKKNDIDEAIHAVTDVRFVLVWLPNAGNGGKSWGKLRVAGAFPSEAAARAKKQQLLNRYENCGHGEIMVGGCWYDEIDLVIKPVNDNL
mmetsp:Transcript_34475/g.54335  ORF Transcript_34475/g.54335 Transcript_34475/m.54335 type:complete len:137 (-) Transcript_34475:415-825(-)